jgi:hypothetical protein
MGKLLKYATVLILAVLAGFLYMMNEESFFADEKKSLFLTPISSGRPTRMKND